MTNQIAIIVAEFNTEITDALLQGCIEKLKSSNINESQIQVYKVPGAVEAPLVAKLLAKKNEYKAIIVLGAVIRGETGHYDYVCKQVSDGCQQVMLEFEVPVIFGILTTDNIHQAKDRIGGRVGHKGKEAAEAAIEMMKLVEELN